MDVGSIIIVSFRQFDLKKSILIDEGISFIEITDYKYLFVNGLRF